jgi:hypothetical protein
MRGGFGLGKFGCGVGRVSGRGGDWMEVSRGKKCSELQERTRRDEFDFRADFDVSGEFGSNM